MFKRIHILFEQTVNRRTSTILLYFRRIKDRRIGAIIFDRRFDVVAPRWITVNPKGWNKVKGYAKVYSFPVTPEFFLLNNLRERDDS
jgi:hypothetical protein